MTQDQLDDLVSDVPSHVSVDASAAWAGGTRRRVRARVAAGAGAVVAVVLLAAVLGVPARGGDGIDPADGRGGVDGYPVRIEQPWSLGDLPDAPGPLAGLLETRGDHGWLAVSSTGRLWRLPHQQLARDVRPALSPDGTRLAYLDEDHGPGARWVVRDLIDGAETPYGLSIGTRQLATFSPDGRRVLVVRNAGEQPSVLGPGVDERELELPPRTDPVGWADDDTVVLLGRGIRASVRSLDLDLVRGSFSPVLVRPIETVATAEQAPGGAVSPDGSTLALRADLDADEGVVVERFDLSTGSASPEIRVAGDAPGCPVAWRGDEPIVSTGTGRGDPTILRSATVGSDDGSALVVADPDLEVSCSVWAADALAGEPHRGLTAHLFGTSDFTPWWWWRDALLAALAALVGRLLVLPPLLRRRQLRHSSRSTP